MIIPLIFGLILYIYLLYIGGESLKTPTLFIPLYGLIVAIWSIAFLKRME